MSAIREILRKIVPDNIKDIEIYNTCVDIFIDVIEELSKESIDIANYINNDNIKEELFKIHMNDLYTTLVSVEGNQTLLNVINSMNLAMKASDPGYEYMSKTIIQDIVKDLNDEYFAVFRSIKETKGTIGAIEYVYKLISSYVKLPSSTLAFNYRDDKPFEISIVGSLPEEFFTHFVSPIVKPIGFLILYSSLKMDFLLKDYYFPTTFTYYGADGNWITITCSIDNENPICDLDLTSITIEDFNVEDFNEFKRIIIKTKSDSYLPNSTITYDKYASLEESSIKITNSSNVTLYECQGCELIYDILTVTNKNVTLEDNITDFTMHMYDTPTNYVSWEVPNVPYLMFVGQPTGFTVGTPGLIVGDETMYQTIEENDRITLTEFIQNPDDTYEEINDDGETVLLPITINESMPHYKDIDGVRVIVHSLDNLTKKYARINAEPYYMSTGIVPKTKIYYLDELQTEISHIETTEHVVYYSKFSQFSDTFSIRTETV